MEEAWIAWLREHQPELYRQMLASTSHAIEWRDEEIRVQTRLRQETEKLVAVLRKELGDLAEWARKLRQDRYDLLCLQTKEGLGASEWQARCAGQRTRIKELEAQVAELTDLKMGEWRSAQN